MTDSRQCRWGILGAAVIARKNWQAIRLSGNGRLVAVASRDVQRTETYINELQACCPHPIRPEACRDYEALLARPDIDAVYIPLPTGIRTEWVLKAIAAGKHVLGEKPVGVSVEDVRKILSACERSKRQFMDGVMFMHSARLPQLRRTLDDEASVGTIRRIATQFSFQAPEAFLQDNIRVDQTLEPLGCLGDLGWYNIRFTLWAMKFQMPAKVSARMLMATGGSSTGVPLEFSAEMFFESGASASFYCSFRTENQQWAHISGTKGNVVLRDFVLPYYGADSTYRVSNTEFEVTGCDFKMLERAREVSVPEYSNSATNSQETNLFRTFGQLVLDGKIDSQWGDMALKTQLVLDACLKSAQADGALQTVG